jgi:hypothetical protein
VGFTVKKLAMTGAIAVAVIVAGASRSKPDLSAPPPLPPVALSDTVLQSAAVYQAFVERAGGINADFKSGSDVAQSLSFGDSYDPQQLLRGEVAYAAVAALQDPTFVSNFRVYAGEEAYRQQIASAIAGNPGYAASFKGADEAAGLAVATLLSGGQKMMDKGAAVKQAAYAIQHDAWSKELVVGRAERLANAKLGVMQVSSADDMTRLELAANGAAPLSLTGQALPPPYSPVVLRGLAVAALAALGEAGQENAAFTAPLLTDPDPASSNCLNMAKLNLYQCLAVAKPHYEDVFCLGQHALADTGQCLMIGAGAPAPVTEALPVSKTEVSYAPKKARRKHKTS